MNEANRRKYISYNEGLTRRERVQTQVYQTHIKALTRKFTPENLEKVSEHLLCIALDKSNPTTAMRAARLIFDMLTYIHEMFPEDGSYIHNEDKKVYSAELLRIIDEAHDNLLRSKPMITNDDGSDSS